MSFFKLNRSTGKQRLEFVAASLDEKLNLVKMFDDEIIENCAVDEIETEIQESDEINSRVMDLLRLINEATTPKDNNAGISTNYECQRNYILWFEHQRKYALWFSTIDYTFWIKRNFNFGFWKCSHSMTVELNLWWNSIFWRTFNFSRWSYAIIG